MNGPKRQAYPEQHQCGAYAADCEGTTASCTTRPPICRNIKHAAFSNERAIPHPSLQHVFFVAFLSICRLSLARKRILRKRASNAPVAHHETTHVQRQNQLHPSAKYHSTFEKKKKSRPKMQPTKVSFTQTEVFQDPTTGPHDSVPPSRWRRYLLAPPPS